MSHVMSPIYESCLQSCLLSGTLLEPNIDDLNSLLADLNTGKYLNSLYLTADLPVLFCTRLLDYSSTKNSVKTIQVQKNTVKYFCTWLLDYLIFKSASRLARVQSQT